MQGTQRVTGATLGFVHDCSNLFSNCFTKWVETTENGKEKAGFPKGPAFLEDSQNNGLGQLKPLYKCENGWLEVRIHILSASCDVHRIRCPNTVNWES